VYESESKKELEEIEKQSKDYQWWIKEELKKSKNALFVARVGKVNPMMHLENIIEKVLTNNISQLLSMALGKEVFYN
jgi:hypothetical protein